MPGNDLYHLIMSPMRGGRVTVAFESADDESAKAYAIDWMSRERIPVGAKVCLGRPGCERVVLQELDPTKAAAADTGSATLA